MEKGIIINKYGAVDAQEIMRLIGRVDRMAKVLENLAGIKYTPMPHSIYADIIERKLPEDFKKMKELTKVDDYEYKITPETKKLVKKQK